MMEITVRDALPADVPFLRDALAKLNDEMETLSGAAGFRAERFPGLNIEWRLQRDSFLIAVAGEEPRGFLSIYLPYPVTGQIIGSAPTDGNDQHSLCLAYVSETGHRVPAARVDRGQMPCMRATGIHLGFIEGNVAAEAALQEGWICDDEAVHAAISGLSGAAMGRAAQLTLSQMRYAICALQYLRRSI